MVKAHYIDQNTKEAIIPDATLTGKFGEAYPDPAKEIPGYVLVSKPEGTFSDKEKDITYFYAKLVTVKAHYIDQNTQDNVAPDATLTGKFGEAYPDPAREIPGYVLVSKPEGTFSDKEKDITYFYVKIVLPGGTDPAVKGATVTVHYQDAKGNPLAPDEILSGKVGEGYVSAAKTIAGYELVNRPENATGFFSQNPQSVTYIYAPVESNSSKHPGQNNQTGGGSDNSHGSNHASHGKGKHSGQNNQTGGGSNNNQGSSHTSHDKGKHSGQNNQTGGGRGSNNSHGNSHASHSNGKQPHNDHANSKNKQQTVKTAPVQPEHKSPAGKQIKVTKEVAETEGTAQLAQTGSAEKEQAAALTLGSLSLLGGLVGSWFNRRKKKD